VRWQRLEVVLLEVVGDLLAEHRTLRIGSAEVDAGPHSGVDYFLQHVGEPVEAPRGARFTALLPVYRHRDVVTSLPPEKSIAVLPFFDLSQTKDQEYFCDGISEEIRDALAKVDGLRVVGRTSSFSFKGKNANAIEIGKKLRVANVLEGTLRREGNRVRITTELIDASSGFRIWSETYERELQGMFALQDEITRAIVAALKLKFAISLPSLERPNIEGYDLYLQGLYFSNRGTEEDLRRALSFFQRCLDGLPMAYHALGRKANSDDAHAALIAKYEKDGPYNIASVYAYRGEGDKAFGCSTRRSSTATRASARS
jgi:TolB-like protein